MTWLGTITRLVVALALFPPRHAARFVLDVGDRPFAHLYRISHVAQRDDRLYVTIEQKSWSEQELRSMFPVCLSGTATAQQCRQLEETAWKCSDFLGELHTCWRGPSGHGFDATAAAAAQRYFSVTVQPLSAKIFAPTDFSIGVPLYHVQYACSVSGWCSGLLENGFFVAGAGKMATGILPHGVAFNRFKTQEHKTAVVPVSITVDDWNSNAVLVYKRADRLRATGIFPVLLQLKTLVRDTGTFFHRDSDIDASQYARELQMTAFKPGEQHIATVCFPSRFCLMLGPAASQITRIVCCVAADDYRCSTLVDTASSTAQNSFVAQTLSAFDTIDKTSFQTRPSKFRHIPELVTLSSDGTVTVYPHAGDARSVSHTTAQGRITHAQIQCGSLVPAQCLLICRVEHTDTNMSATQLIFRLVRPSANTQAIPCSNCNEPAPLVNGAHFITHGPFADQISSTAAEAAPEIRIETSTNTYSPLLGNERTLNADGKSTLRVSARVAYSEDVTVLPTGQLPRWMHVAAQQHNLQTLFTEGFTTIAEPLHIYTTRISNNFYVTSGNPTLLMPVLAMNRTYTAAWSSSTVADMASQFNQYTQHVYNDIRDEQQTRILPALVAESVSRAASETSEYIANVKATPVTVTADERDGIENGMQWHRMYLKDKSIADEKDAKDSKIDTETRADTLLMRRLRAENQEDDYYANFYAKEDEEAFLQTAPPLEAAESSAHVAFNYVARVQKMLRMTRAVHITPQRVAAESEASLAITPVLDDLVLDIIRDQTHHFAVRAAKMYPAANTAVLKYLQVHPRGTSELAQLARNMLIGEDTLAAFDTCRVATPEFMSIFEYMLAARMGGYRPSVLFATLSGAFQQPLCKSTIKLHSPVIPASDNIKHYNVDASSVIATSQESSTPVSFVLHGENIHAARCSDEAFQLLHVSSASKSSGNAEYDHFYRKCSLVGMGGSTAASQTVKIIGSDRVFSSSRRSMLFSRLYFSASDEGTLARQTLVSFRALSGCVALADVVIEYSESWRIFPAVTIQSHAILKTSTDAKWSCDSTVQGLVVRGPEPGALKRSTVASRAVAFGATKKLKTVVVASVKGEFIGVDVTCLSTAPMSCLRIETLVGQFSGISRVLTRNCGWDRHACISLQVFETPTDQESFVFITSALTYGAAPGISTHGFADITAQNINAYLSSEHESVIITQEMHPVVEESHMDFAPGDRKIKQRNFIASNPIYQRYLEYDAPEAVSLQIEQSIVIFDNMRETHVRDASYRLVKMHDDAALLPYSNINQLARKWRHARHVQLHGESTSYADADGTVDYNSEGDDNEVYSVEAYHFLRTLYFANRHSGIIKMQPVSGTGSMFQCRYGCGIRAGLRIFHGDRKKGKLHAPVLQSFRSGEMLHATVNLVGLQQADLDNGRYKLHVFHVEMCTDFSTPGTMLDYAAGPVRSPCHPKTHDHNRVRMVRIFSHSGRHDDAEIDRIDEEFIRKTQPPSPRTQKEEPNATHIKISAAERHAHDTVHRYLFADRRTTTAGYYPRPDVFHFSFDVTGLESDPAHVSQMLIAYDVVDTYKNISTVPRAAYLHGEIDPDVMNPTQIISGNVQITCDESSRIMDRAGPTRPARIVEGCLPVYTDPVSMYITPTVRQSSQSIVWILALVVFVYIVALAVAQTAASPALITSAGKESAQTTQQARKKKE